MQLGFSIIIVTRNSLPELEECLGSILMQDYPQVQLVFVDGGSTDGTLDEIRALRRPVALIENAHGNTAWAMNRGLEAATGDIIGFLNADEYYLDPQVLTKVERELEERRHGWLFGRALLDLDGHLHADSAPFPPYSYETLLYANFIRRPATFVRRNLLQRAGGFDPALRHAADYDLWLKLGCMAEPVRMDSPLAAFRDDEGSLYTGQRLAAIDESYRVRMAHEGRHLPVRALHFARYLVRRQLAMRAGATG